MIDIMLDDHLWKDVEADTEALLDKWLVSPGAPVKAGDALADVTLVKTTLTIEAPCDGTIEEVLINEQETFARGQPVARLRPN